jgi:hypothetical protein
MCKIIVIAGIVGVYGGYMAVIENNPNKHAYSGRNRKIL